MPEAQEQQSMRFWPHHSLGRHGLAARALVAVVLYLVAVLPHASLALAGPHATYNLPLPSAGAPSTDAPSTDAPSTDALLHNHAGTQPHHAVHSVSHEAQMCLDQVDADDTGNALFDSCCGLWCGAMMLAGFSPDAGLVPVPGSAMDPDPGFVSFTPKLETPPPRLA